MTPTVTISLTRYGEPDSMVREVLSHACRQSGVTGEVLFVEQRRDSGTSEQEFAGLNLPLRIVRPAVGSLSEARNVALAQARHRIVLFLDADAIAEPDWALRLAEVLSGGRFAIAGSQIVPRWRSREPWMAGANVVRDQYSLLELGDKTMAYPRVVGAAFGVDMDKLPPGLTFDIGLGRRGGRLFGGEESDFCRRAAEAGCEIAYVGGARVHHIIAPERARLSWIVRRMFYAGYGRASVGGAPSPSRALNRRDWLSLPFIAPAYTLGWLRGRLAASSGRRA